MLVDTLSRKLTPYAWLIIAVTSTVLSQVAMVYLGLLYEQTQFPVPFWQGQTTFNAPQLKQYFHVLIELNTLERFYQVQLWDYLYMLTVLLSFGSLVVAIHCFLPNLAWLKRCSASMLFIAPSAALFDALENAVSFVMLQQPLHFSDGWVYPYSGLAVAKFAVYGITYLWVILALLVIAASKLGWKTKANS